MVKLICLRSFMVGMTVAWGRPRPERRFDRLRVVVSNVEGRGARPPSECRGGRAGGAPRAVRNADALRRDPWSGTREPVELETGNWPLATKIIPLPLVQQHDGRAGDRDDGGCGSAARGCGYPSRRALRSPSPAAVQAGAAPVAIVVRRSRPGSGNVSEGRPFARVDPGRSAS